MIIKHEGRDWTYQEGKLTLAQAIVIKNHTGLNIKAWQESLEEMDPLSWQAMWWLVKQQNGVVQPVSEVDTDVVELMEAIGRADEAEKQAKAAQNGQASGDVLAPPQLGAAPTGDSAPTSNSFETATSGILPTSVISPPPTSTPSP